MNNKQKLDYFLSEIEDIKQKQKPYEYYWHVEKHYKKNELRNVVFLQKMEFTNALKYLTDKIKSLAADVYATADTADKEEDNNAK